MKKTALLTLFLCSVLFGSRIDKQQIFILHSYTQEYDWTKSQHKAFTAYLGEHREWPLEYFTEDFDTKRVALTADYEQFFLHYLQSKYANVHPAAVYVTDDNALQFFTRHQAELFPDAPVFFSGINNTGFAASLDKSIFTGVIETKEVGPNLELIRQFSPQTRDIWFVGDAGETYRAIELEIKKYVSQYPRHRFHFLASKNISDVLNALPHNQKSFVILTTIGGFIDDQGNHLTLKESINLIRSKPGTIILSMEDAYVTDGVVGGYVTSGEKQGTEAAKLLLRHLRGEPVSEIPNMLKSPNEYVFDHEALVGSRVILSEYIKRNAKVLHDEKSFSEKYHSLILEFLFLLCTALLILITIFFLVAAQKRRQCSELRKESKEAATQLERHRIRLSHLEEDLQLGIWEKTVQTGDVWLSEHLRTMLKIDQPSPETSIDDLLSYIHPGDMAEFKNALEALMENRTEAFELHHRMIADNDDVITVNHHIHRVAMADQETLLGLIERLDA